MAMTAATGGLSGAGGGATDKARGGGNVRTETEGNGCAIAVAADTGFCCRARPLALAAAIAAGELAGLGFTLRAGGRAAGFCG